MTSWRWIYCCILAIIVVCMPMWCSGNNVAAYYSFDEGSGTVAKDSSGNGNDGIIMGAQYVKSPKGYALKFDGLAAHVDCGTGKTFKLSRDFTFTAWIKLSVPIIPDFNTNWTIFNNEIFGKEGAILRLDGVNGKLYYRANSSESSYGNVVISEKSIDNNLYYHIALVKKDMNLTIFIDGIPDITTSVRHAESGVIPFTISAGGQAMNGIIDEVKIYNQAQTPGEIITEYKRNASLFGKDTLAFGKIKITPFVYYDEKRAIADVDFTGILPLEDGSQAILKLSEAKKGTIEMRTIDVPQSGRKDFVFPLDKLPKGHYRITVSVKDNSDKSPFKDSIEFNYPWSPKKVPSSVQKNLLKLSAKSKPIPYSVEMLSGGVFNLIARGERYPMKSYFSYPNGGFNLLGENTGGENEPLWKPISKKVNSSTYQITALGKYYSLDRSIKLYPNRIMIKDTIKNLTESRIGIILGNGIRTNGHNFTHHLLGGNKVTSVKGAKIGMNPTAFLGREDLGIGVIALDDVYIVQARGDLDEENASVGSDSFALDIGASYTLEWAIYLGSSSDYYDFINQVRWDEKINGKIDGGLWMNQYARDGAPSKYDIDVRGLKFINLGCLSWCADDPEISLEGLEFLEYPKEMARIKKAAEGIRIVDPSIKTVFHIAHSLYATNNRKQTLSDSLVVNADGTLPLYNEGIGYFSDQRRKEGWVWGSYYATLDNSLGKLLMNSVDTIVNDLGCSGVFMDGFAECYGARYTFDRWDGNTADIDPKTNTIIRLKGDLTLLQQDCMIAFARKVRAKGGTVFANGSSLTRKIAHESYILHDREIVAGPMGHLLPTSVCLANPEVVMGKGDVAIYKDVQDKLRWGELFFNYGDASYKYTRKPIFAYFYPFSFEELHSGYVKGKERLVTMLPGLYGWQGEKYLHHTYLADARGVIIPSSFLTTIDAFGARTQLDIKENQMVVLKKIPVQISAKSSVNTTVLQYDTDKIIAMLNGFGNLTVYIGNGEFQIEPKTYYLVNGRSVLSGKDSKIIVPLALNGEMVISVEKQAKRL